VPKSNLGRGYPAQRSADRRERLSLGKKKGGPSGPPLSRKCDVGYFLLVAAFFLLKPVSTEAPMLDSMSLAGCAY
jgi:hypothetical protein